jgi:ATP synthase protein I
MTHAERRETDPMQKSIARFSARRARWKSETTRTIMLAAAITGLGWLVVVPAVAGFLAGRWLDARFGTGIVLSAGAGLVGLVFGAFAAWRRVGALLRHP